MKIRRGFVTNSSSTNFGAMLVTSFAAISAASLISPLDFDANAKEKSYVKLVVSVPSNRVLLPGKTVSISAEIFKADIVKGKIMDDLCSVGFASITCIKGSDICAIEPAKSGGDSSTLSFTVTSDADKLLHYSDEIIFKISGSYEGHLMSSTVSFRVPCFSVSPEKGIFLAESENEETVNLVTNYETEFTYDFEATKALSKEILEETTKKQKIKLMENIVDVKQFFNNYTCKTFLNIKVDSEAGESKISRNYLATLIRESIIVPKSFKPPMPIQCYTEKDKDKRLQNAFLLPIKVMKYDKDKKDLVTDIGLTNNLEFDFQPLKNQKGLTDEQAQKAVNDAALVAELLPDTGAATDSKPYATYRIYADALSEARTDKVNMDITISCDNYDIEDIIIKSLLKPKIDLKGLIEQFINYPEGTLIGTCLKLGDVAKYHKALDYLSEVKLVNVGNPKYDPNTNAMSLREVPESINEFVVVQTLHHELAHTIEMMEGDSFMFGSGEFGERHSYYIQHLSDASKKLADIERNYASDIQAIISGSIYDYYMVYNNWANLVEKPNEGEINSWFGARTMTQHQVFDKFLNFGAYCQNNALSEQQKSRVEKVIAQEYFPGDILGRWTESDGIFKGSEWTMIWKYGNFTKVTLTHPEYTFKTVSRKWKGSNNLRLEIKFEVVRNSDKDEDEIIAILDAGTFDNNSHKYPNVDKFNLTWKAGRTLSDCILGDYRDKSLELIKK